MMEVCIRTRRGGFRRGAPEKSPGQRSKERENVSPIPQKNESIVINDDITIVVVEIRGDKVRLGVEAPKEVPVHRREVFDAIHRNDSTGEKRPTRPTLPATADNSVRSSPELLFGRLDCC